MASRKRPARRPVRPQPSGNGPRRLGGEQVPARSTGAQRRYQRSHRGRRTGMAGWAAIGVVAVVLIVLIALKVTSSNSPGADTAGRHPAAAPAAAVLTLSSIPTSTYNAVGTGGLTVPFTVAKNQPSLASAGKPRFVYEGAEYCPYCALIRWSLVAALSRFGAFHGLAETTSNADVAPIPTFSFLGATYTSNYVDFTPYEQSDRIGNSLQSVPSDVTALYTKYDGSGSSASTPFNATGGPGIPFLDIGNKYLEQGDPAAFIASTGPKYTLAGTGISRMIAIADAIANPNSSFGKVISAKEFVGEANYITAAICSLDGGKPTSVCSTPGVQKALTALKKAKAVS